MAKLRKGRVVVSPVSGRGYRIGEVLGEGGFGTTYRALEVDDERRPLQEVCLKTTTDQSSWHREAYFGELLRGCRRVIQTLDTFPLVPSSVRAPLRFAVVLELAEHGTVADYLQATGRPWSPRRARRELLAILKVLDHLHQGSATHRDLTPMNVFVCRRRTLKLGDFGIARHQIGGSGPAPDAFNPDFVTPGFLANDRRPWHAVDDVYQLGQLLGMLLRGDPDTIVEAAMVDALDCDRGLKRIVKRAIGPRSRRYTDADEMIRALERDEARSLRPPARRRAG